MEKSTAVEFVKGLFSEVWCKRKPDAVAKYYHPEFQGLLNETESFEYADVVKRQDYSNKRYENPHCVFHDIFPAEGNRIVARVSSTAFDRQAQKDTQLHFSIIIEIQNGKMIRQWTMSNVPYRYKDWEI